MVRGVWWEKRDAWSVADEEWKKVVRYGEGGKEGSGEW